MTYVFPARKSNVGFIKKKAQDQSISFVINVLLVLVKAYLLLLIYLMFNGFSHYMHLCTILNNLYYLNF